jgi:hypothetical protein
MPQLVKGGKYSYGWSHVSETGVIKIFKEALEEYGFKSNDRLILLPGSLRSKGFIVTTIDKLSSTILEKILGSSPNALFDFPEGTCIQTNGKKICWVKLDSNDCISLPLKTLKEYGVEPGDNLLSVRGSHVGIGFPVTGPIINEAMKHNCLKLISP